MLRSISPNNRYDLVLGGKSPPVICGVNTGQHMYLDASPSCNDIKIDVNTGSTTTRQWQIKVATYFLQQCFILFRFEGSVKHFPSFLNLQIPSCGTCATVWYHQLNLWTIRKINPEIHTEKRERGRERVCV